MAIGSHEEPTMEPAHDRWDTEFGGVDGVAAVGEVLRW